MKFKLKNKIKFEDVDFLQNELGDGAYYKECSILAFHLNNNAINIFPMDKKFNNNNDRNKRQFKIMQYIYKYRKPPQVIISLKFDDEKQFTKPSKPPKPKRNPYLLNSSTKSISFQDEKCNIQEQDTITSIEDINIRALYVVSGWIRTFIPKNLYSIFPQELNVIIANFAINMFLKFDVFPDEYKNCVTDGGQRLIIPKYSILPDMRVCFGCCLGVNNGNHTFKIKCIKSGYHDKIGVITSVFQCKNEDFCPSTASGVAYYFHPIKGIHENEKIKNTDPYTPTSNLDRIQIAYKDKKQPLWKPNDVIKINLDFVNGKITFFKNDTVISILNMDKNNIYHLMVNTPTLVKKPTCQYEIIY